MASNKTRLSNSQRAQIMATGNVRPASQMSPSAGNLAYYQSLVGTDKYDELRKLGRLACSKVDAIMSRRRELGRA